MREESPGHDETQRQPDPLSGEKHFWSSHASTILVPLDGSKEAKMGLVGARLMAQVLDACIHVVHASEEPLSQAELFQRTGLTREETRGVVIVHARGTAAEGILRLAKEKTAVLIAMTTRGRTAYRGRTVRPVVERIISGAPCPVLLIRPEIGQRAAEMRELRRVLLPLDGAPSSAAVIAPVLELAQITGAEVDVLYVATQAKRPEERGTLTTPLYVDQPQHEWPAWSQEFLRRFGTCLGRRPLPPSVRLFLRRGGPAEEILGLALDLDIDLIALEWRGSLDPPHAAVARGVLRDAPCPVLLLRTNDGNINSP